MGIALVKKFYIQQGATSSGYTLAGLQRMGRWWNVFGYSQLENLHDYIQYLFPTSQTSRFHPQAPIVQLWEVLKLRRTDPQAFSKIQDRMRDSLHLMLGFYGLQMDIHGTITPSSSWRQRSVVWLTANNHNLLRLTRILSSLNMFGLNIEAKALFATLEGIYKNQGKEIVSPRTFSYWKQASSQESFIFRLYSYFKSMV